MDKGATKVGPVAPRCHTANASRKHVPPPCEKRERSFRPSVSKSESRKSDAHRTSQTEERWTGTTHEGQFFMSNRPVWVRREKQRVGFYDPPSVGVRHQAQWRFFRDWSGAGPRAPGETRKSDPSLNGEKRLCALQYCGDGNLEITRGSLKVVAPPGVGIWKGKEVRVSGVGTLGLNTPTRLDSDSADAMLNRKHKSSPPQTKECSTLGVIWGRW